METSIVISGFGGQGTLFAGQVLAYAANDHDKHVTWIPSYGPEMRGGTAHCTVIISDDEIGSPLVRNPDVVLAMNLPSLDKYENRMEKDSILIVNTSLINRDVEREDIRVINIPASDIAEEIGDKRLANMVMLGAMIELSGVLPMEVIKMSLEGHLPERHKKTLPLNFQALDKGRELAK
ncbi:MAG: 2-oxoacid:acceptor oxidoreductase family protein [Anaerolineales bacterium]|nr:2-oxoacid:acceptor oxidoreductase family protein [Anaerolineales bacterium]